MSYLYVNESGSSINIENGYFVVKYKNDMSQKIPKETLESIILFGNIQMTSQSVRECLYKGIPISYFSEKGAYFGRLVSTSHTNIFKLKKQIYLSDDSNFSLQLSKKIIKAKIHNQIVILKRYIRNSTENLENEISSIEAIKNKIDMCTSINQIIGYEGNASKNYFRGISMIINEEFGFRGRNRMPPKDPFNSMISLGYTLLMYEIYGEIENQGLNPYAGFLHKDRERHPTLASDLMEEWRAVLVDSFVLSMIQKHEIKKEHFFTNEETYGVYLNKDGMKIFLNKYEQKMRTEAKYLDYISYRISFRKSILLQVRQLAKSITEENIEIYEPIKIR